MTKQVVIFKLLALLHLGIMFGLPLQVAWQDGHSLLELSTIFAKLSLMNWLVFTVSGVMAALYWRQSVLLKMFIPLFTLLVLVNNGLVAHVGLNASANQIWTATGLFVTSQTLFYYFLILPFFRLPRRLWRSADKRLRTRIPITVIPTFGQAFRTATFDISVGGAFLPQESSPTNEVPWSCLPENIRPGDQIIVLVKVGALRKLRFQAQVVRKAAAIGSYPSGIGIQFQNLDRLSRNELHRLVSQ